MNSYQVKVTGKDAIGQNIWLVFLARGRDASDAIEVIKNKFDLSAIKAPSFDSFPYPLDSLQMAGNLTVRGR